MWFFRPHLDYNNIIYDQMYNGSLQQKVEAIPGAIRGTAKENFFQELGLESLQYRWWYRKLCCFYEVLKNLFLKDLFNIIHKLDRWNSTRNANNTPHFKVKHSFLKNTFFPSAIIEWNKLDLEIQNTPGINIFKNNISVYKTYHKQHI